VQPRRSHHGTRTFGRCDAPSSTDQCHEDGVYLYLLTHQSQSRWMRSTQDLSAYARPCDQFSLAEDLLECRLRGGVMRASRMPDGMDLGSTVLRSKRRRELAIYVSIVPLPRNPCDPRVRFGCRTKHAAGDDGAGMDGLDG
jgi:hypothetical protein